MEGEEEIRRAGKLARDVLKDACAKVAEGVKYSDISDFVDEAIAKAKAGPAFPVNISVNEVAAHYTPTSGDDSVFEKGDVVKIDLGVHVDGYPSDTAATVIVGENARGAELKTASEEALAAATAALKLGTSLQEVGKAIETAISARGFQPIRNLTGHSMARWDLHAGLSVFNYDTPNDVLEPDTLIAVEPFSTNGAGKVLESKPSSIYKLLGPVPQRLPGAKKLLARIFSDFQTFPFAQRWLRPTELLHLPQLVASGAVHRYPILMEEAKGIVAQSEHTFLVGEKEIEQIT